MASFQWKFLLVLTVSAPHTPRHMYCSTNITLPPIATAASTGFCILFIRNKLITIIKGRLLSMMHKAFTLVMYMYLYVSFYSRFLLFFLFQTNWNINECMEFSLKAQFQHQKAFILRLHQQTSIIHCTVFTDILCLIGELYWISDKILLNRVTFLLLFWIKIFFYSGYWVCQQI